MQVLGQSPSGIFLQEKIVRRLGRWLGLPAHEN